MSSCTGVLQLARDPEVSHLRPEVAIDQDVTSLDISMDFLVIMQVLQAQENLSDDDADLYFQESTLQLPHYLRDRTMLTELHDNHESVRRACGHLNAKDLHNLWAGTSSAKDTDFLLHGLEGRSVLWVVMLIEVDTYVNNLNSIDRTCRRQHSSMHLPIRALADLLLKLKTSDIFLSQLPIGGPILLMRHLVVQLGCHGWR
mmetsp:Transcript_42534/g.74692  ORF Transcript_42534/g.74692 Transcript_42534/m.74692 type:complete len:201 (-) Transcript_42534:21-623(-)